MVVTKHKVAAIISISPIIIFREGKFTSVTEVGK